MAIAPEQVDRVAHSSAVPIIIGVTGHRGMRPSDFPRLKDQVRTILEELECHVTTLNPGAQSHPPHKHPNEELVIVREGIVEVLVNGEWKKVGPGSVIFNASNQLHALRNVGTGPATYHVINWQSPGSKKAQP